MTVTALERARLLRVVERDGWACTMPNCTSRGPFCACHVVRPEHGGTDAEWNLTTLCEPCEALVRGGFILLRGRAPHRLEFRFGEGFSRDGSTAEIHRSDMFAWSNRRARRGTEA